MIRSLPSSLSADSDLVDTLYSEAKRKAFNVDKAIALHHPERLLALAKSHYTKQLLLIRLPDYRHFASISAVFIRWIQTKPLPASRNYFDLEENTEARFPFFSVVM